MRNSFGLFVLGLALLINGCGGGGGGSGSSSATTPTTTTTYTYTVSTFAGSGSSGFVNGTGTSVNSSLVDLRNYFSALGRDSFAKVSDTITLAVYSPSGSPAGHALLSWQEML